MKKALNFACLPVGMALLTLLARPAYAGNSSIFTVSAWVRPETSVASKALVGKAEELRVFTDASGYLGCQIKSTTWQTAASSTSALSLNAWSHVACTYDKITLRVYLNGVQVGSQALTATIDDTAAALKYGIDDSASTTYTPFKGTIDELKFYNYARTAKQIVEDMNAGAPAVSASGKDPIAFYKFDEGYGLTANNSGSAGQTLNGTFGATTAAPTWNNNGKFGKALQFDGSNDYVSATVGALSSFTISGWFKQSVTGVASQKWIGICENADNTKPSWIGSGNTNEFTKWDAGVNGLDGSPIEVTGTDWNFYVIVYDGIAGKYYKNGKLKAMGVNTSFSYTNAKVHLGKRAWADSGYFNGLIDEVKIYNYALTEDEVKLEYNRGSALQLGSVSNTALLSGGSIASSSASAAYCIPGDTATCSPPVGEWKFEEGKNGTCATGKDVCDTSGNGNNGAWSGTGTTHWTAGKVGKAGKFNGTDDHVNVGTISYGVSDYTIEGWFKTSLVGPEDILAGYIGSNHFNLLEVTSTGILRYLHRAPPAGSGGTDIVSTNAVNNNKWHYFAATLQANTKQRIYVDGVLNSETTPSGTYSDPISIGFGDLGVNSSRKFSGTIDEVKIFNYARSAQQISWDYNRGKPVAHYKFDECSGTLAHDSSGNNYNGTLTGGTPGTCTDGTGTTAWNRGSTGKYNSSLKFDGTNYVNQPTSITGAQTVGFWVYPTNTSQSFLQLSSTATVTSSGGVVSAGAGFASPTIYVNGTPSTTLRASSWNHIVVTTATGITANAIKLGLVGTTYYTGQMDDVQIYNYALTAVQVKNLYNQNAAVRFGPSTGSP